ncbi:hypothetical protein [Alteromonas gilva]|uniref:Uncharacterized protein n=1 Tax=Alteromonas gilva TaxID=2987522 RepID=A0ABT5L7V0_9ALTE|nr:hypothetical protein [Alteromonas gilva]MDC8832963.1 hypothetical protein [Alteromonas gilva]
MMKALDYVKRGDRSTTVLDFAKNLVNGSINIGLAEDMADELMSAKAHFEAFYGDESKEYKMTKIVLNLVRTIVRSIRIQNESPNQTLENWASAMPIRIQWIEQLSHIVKPEH